MKRVIKRGLRTAGFLFSGDFWGGKQGIMPLFSTSWVLTCFALLIIVLIGFLLCCGGTEPPSNVVLISVDTLRADKVGCYGSGETKTRFMDMPARKGMQFINAYCPIPCTFPSHASMLTGLAPDRHGLRSNAGRLLEGRDFPLLAPILKKRGFRTGAFLSLRGLASSSGLAEGFDVTDDTGFGWQRAAGETVSNALEWISGEPENNFFLWLHLFDPHAPYAPPSPYDEMHYSQSSRTKKFPINIDRGSIPSIIKDKSITDLTYYQSMYLGEISYSDRCLEKFFYRLAELELLEKSVIILTADHGECFGEEDLFFDHSWRLSEASVRVPLLIWRPGIDSDCTLIERAVSLVDIMPTILEMLNIDEELDLDGFNIHPGAEDKTEEMRPLYIEIGPDQIEPAQRLRCAVNNLLKACYSPVEEGYWWNEHRIFAYDLSDDPSESNPESPDESEEAKKLIEFIKNRIEADVQTETGHTVDKPHREMLQALGYLQNGMNEALPADQNLSVRENADGNFGPPGIISPADNSISRRRLRFEWKPVDGAENYIVRFRSLFSKEEINELQINDTNLDRIIGQAAWDSISPGIYCWSVAAAGPGNKRGPFSEQRRFRRSPAPQYHFRKNEALRIEAEELPGNTGRIAERSEASGGAIMSAEAIDEPNYLIFGPYIALPPGNFQAVCNIKMSCSKDLDDDIPITCIEAVEKRGALVLNQKDVLVEHLRNGQIKVKKYNDILLPFRHDGKGGIEFRVFHYGNGDIEIDYIDLISIHGLNMP